MLEYVLFDKKSFQLFIDWLKDKGVVYETGIEEGNYLIQVSEDLDDDLLDAIEDKYDECMEMSQDILNTEDDYTMSGIIVELKDGSVSHADVEPDLINRILSVISPEELGCLVNAIADAVENPQPESFCQRQREE
ncbi:MAG: hypothetical protein OQK72_03060 [Gammaproteobacteria bacterium]|nr:hypothetical protein [Gammaproteobacteria bacterium]MCW9057161.1 hypothetical protein [Gammaproteobacteria bacterium]